MLQDPNLLSLTQVTEAAAAACFDWIGLGDEKKADQAAVSAMRSAFNKVSIDGRIVIGEGERDQAPMLYIGERVGKGGIEYDIALDPLEGTTLCAHNAPNSITTLAIAQKGGFLHAPDVYMQKIAIGSNLPEDLIDLEADVQENIKNLSKAKKCDIRDLCIVVLARDRHKDLISSIRAAGAKIKLISDGDVLGSIATALPNTGIDMYIGIGGAPEGVLAAAALKAVGGQMQGKLLFENQEQIDRAKLMGITDINQKYSQNEMAKGDVIFFATGVTNGFLLQGVKKINHYSHNICITNTIVISSAEKSIKKIVTEKLL